MVCELLAQGQQCFEPHSYEVNSINRAITARIERKFSEVNCSPQVDHAGTRGPRSGSHSRRRNPCSKPQFGLREAIVGRSLAIRAIGPSIIGLLLILFAVIFLARGSFRRRPARISSLHWINVLLLGHNRRELRENLHT
jgi:hypothetical protein